MTFLLRTLIALGTAGAFATAAAAQPAVSTTMPTGTPYKMGAAVSAAAAAGPPAGYYECYFYGMYGLQNSSMTDMRVLGDGRYEALGEAGSFDYDAASNTIRMADGGLAGRVAHLEQSDGKPAIVFTRRENEVDGEPTLDVVDTWCYYEPR